MLSNLKALLVVATIGFASFYLMKPMALKFGSANDFDRRRVAWFVLTLCGFASPNFWIFAAMAVLVLLRAQRRDSNVVALYLLLLSVIPDMPVQLPAFGLREFFALGMYRILSLFVLLPVVTRLWIQRRHAPKGTYALTGMDFLVLGFGFLRATWYVIPDLATHASSHDSITNDLRNAFLYVLDVWLPFFAVSRGCRSKKAITEAMFAFCVSAMIMSGIAVFETLKGWLVYGGIAENWNLSAYTFLYVMRGSLLRPDVSANGPLPLGYLIAIALGFWHYLKADANGMVAKFVVPTIYISGLIATFSRGPWLTAVIIYFSMALLGSRPVTTTLKAFAIFAAAASLIIVSPVGNRVASVIPFMGGGLGDETISYREKFIDTAIPIIEAHPLLGDRHAYKKLSSMRQGQHIIDLVNTYLEIALFYGLVGFGLFFGFIGLGVQRLFRCSRYAITHDEDMTRLGGSLIACIIGTLLMLGTCSFINGIEKMYYVLGGFAWAYSSMGSGVTSMCSLLSPGGRPRPD